MTLERDRIPSSLLAAQNHRGREGTFCPRPICSSAERLLKAAVRALMVAWALGTAGSHSKLQGVTGLHLADLPLSRSPPHLLVLSAHSEVMERRFSRKDLGS